jgi:hypothetical protein
MAKRTSERTKVEFGDFQTPPDLSADVCAVLARMGIKPAAVVEPTCGVGNLLLAAMAAFPKTRSFLGMEVNQAYAEELRGRLGKATSKVRHRIEVGSFFETDWATTVADLPAPILFVGNPPWVTSADLGYLKSHNIPQKTNFHGRAGMDALTGKANFDISEWMLLRLLSVLDGTNAVVAMLCKTAVARKVLAFAWESGLRVGEASIHRIDSARHFDAAVHACLLVVRLGPKARSPACCVYDDLSSTQSSATLGYRDGTLIADARHYDQLRSLVGVCEYTWRSGVKHDCAAVMELVPKDNGYVNGDGELVALERRYLFPMLKSSEVARTGRPKPTRWMLVTQSAVGEDTSTIKGEAPLTWKYLQEHHERFEKRASSIYRGKPPYSVFGVGAYTFAPWKVAISGLYKKLAFKVVAPVEGRPVVLDDTCYFLPCESEKEARFLADLLGSPQATAFFSAFVFWDAKRPITAELLRRLSLRALARELSLEAEYDKLCSAPAPKPVVRPVQISKQMTNWNV